ncbi:energy transducer TonB [Rhodoferax sp.]|uniref:energy transducer TonB n=1 Tax=Rhodoferax sp. TaxID=50421 RepID=UPI00271C4766|nr:energy transducer TonB [Rhodoferax sp.]MDO9145616.1 energy transducer TonB [Rhodoferax sp.]
MSYAENQRQSGRKSLGIFFVVVLHLVTAYALVTGLARKAVEVIRGPIETKLIEELKKLPPPDKPPPPRQKVDPPPFVPPAEVAVVAPVLLAPAITATATVVAPAPVEAPPAPPVPPKPVQRIAPVIDAAKNCVKPEYPATSKRLEEEGLVLLRFMIDEGGKVIESRIETSSGYARLDEAARAALSRCQFKPGTADGTPERSWASLKYVWRLE